MKKLIKKLLGKNQDRTRIQCTFKTVYPDVKLDYYAWCKALRVSSLHNVHQTVYFD